MHRDSIRFLVIYENFKYFLLVFVFELSAIVILEISRHSSFHKRKIFTVFFTQINPLQLTHYTVSCEQIIKKKWILFLYKEAKHLYNEARPLFISRELACLLAKQIKKKLYKIGVSNSLFVYLYLGLFITLIMWICAKCLHYSNC